jgi:hypothetical protein
MSLPLDISNEALDCLGGGMTASRNFDRSASKIWRVTGKTGVAAYGPTYHAALTRAVRKSRCPK